MRVILSSPVLTHPTPEQHTHWPGGSTSWTRGIPGAGRGMHLAPPAACPCSWWWSSRLGCDPGRGGRPPRAAVGGAHASGATRLTKDRGSLVTFLLATWKFSRATTFANSKPGKNAGTTFTPKAKLGRTHRETQPRIYTRGKKYYYLALLSPGRQLWAPWRVVQGLSAVRPH